MGNLIHEETDKMNLTVISGLEKWLFQLPLNATNHSMRIFVPLQLPLGTLEFPLPHTDQLVLATVLLFPPRHAARISTYSLQYADDYFHWFPASELPSCLPATMDPRIEARKDTRRFAAHIMSS